ncbi:BPL-N domain-containing protein [Desulfovibrio piger]|uniref:BPL-N domain-containing protein n=1 Tax=Desulfovibrio piger TaxID=901 RepID=UPI0026F01D2D|nr:BPL-N domain-containing protein [Desulfovibrio piger]
MCAANPVCILWDASHIWGLMVWRALCALGLPCRLVKGQDIANGALFRKPCPQGPAGGERAPAPLLLVPGGNARLKARALGEKGRQAVRDYLAEGGRYLGFCGGAGLALSQPRSQDGLGLCPWGRASYPERLHHLISGHAHMRVRSCMARDLPAARPELPVASRPGDSADPLRPPLGDEACALVPPHWRGCALGHEKDCRHCSNCRPPEADGHVPSLPVWWPGRFAPEADERVSILASYRQPDTDFWLADLPLSRIPAPVFEAWKDLYGVNVSADFLDGQPLMVAGNYGRGRYVLSYSHLETPDSHDANAWLAHLLRALAGLAPQRELVPAWDLHRKAAFRWPGTPQTAPLHTLLHGMRGLLDLGVEHNLFFERTSWLWGWRPGLPGAVCNNLYSSLRVLCGLRPGPETLAAWDGMRARFTALTDIFLPGAEGYLLACRLRETLSPTMPDAVDRRGLTNQR